MMMIGQKNNKKEEEDDDDVMKKNKRMKREGYFYNTTSADEDTTLPREIKEFPHRVARELGVWVHLHATTVLGMCQFEKDYGSNIYYIDGANDRWDDENLLYKMVVEHDNENDVLFFDCDEMTTAGKRAVVVVARSVEEMKAVLVGDGLCKW